MGTMTALAVTMGVWPLAILFGVSVLTLAPTAFGGSKITQHLPVPSGSTRAQQHAIGYISGLPFWALLLAYYRGDLLVIAGFLALTLCTAALVARAIGEEGWSQKR
jgi:hypothetical protein